MAIALEGLNQVVLRKMEEIDWKSGIFAEIFSKFSEEIILGKHVMKWAFLSMR